MIEFASRAETVSDIAMKPSHHVVPRAAPQIFRPRAGRAFTLIELLVVVAIVGVLMSILIPALAQAREQGRTALCLSNLHTLGMASLTYTGDFDNLPWVLPVGYTVNGERFSFNVLSGFVWGGGMPDRTKDDWLATGVDFNLDRYRTDVYVIPPLYRPVNRYLGPSVSWNRRAEERTSRPADIPGWFRCPSDSSVDLGWVDQPNRTEDLDTPYQVWAYFGTSYSINFYWPDYYKKAPPGDAAPYNRDFGRIIGVYDRIPNLGKRMLKIKSGRWASEFLVYLENRFNFALGPAMPRGSPDGQSGSRKNIVGWHRKMDHHAAAYLDGHATYRAFETKYVDGPGWTIWPNKPWEGGWAKYNDD